MIGPQNTPKPAVTVWYDADKGRKNKMFTDAYKARSFYAKKLREGRNPEVKKCGGCELKEIK